MSRRYTKSDLEQIVYKQLENLNAIHDLLGIMKFQNDLIQNINQTLMVYNFTLSWTHYLHLMRIGDDKERHFITFVHQPFQGLKPWKG